MASEILLPKIGVSMHGEIAEWLVRDGDKVSEGQSLFSLRTEDSTSVVGAPSTGTLKINARTGHSYEVGTVLGYIEPE